MHSHCTKVAVAKWTAPYIILYTPSTNRIRFDDDEREGLDEENSDSSTDRDPKSDGDESAASAL